MENKHRLFYCLRRLDRWCSFIILERMTGARGWDSTPKHSAAPRASQSADDKCEQIRTPAEELPRSLQPGFVESSQTALIASVFSSAHLRISRQLPRKLHYSPIIWSARLKFSKTKRYGNSINAVRSFFSLDSLEMFIDNWIIDKSVGRSKLQDASEINDSKSICRPLLNRPTVASVVKASLACQSRSALARKQPAIEAQLTMELIRLFRVQSRKWIVLSFPLVAASHSSPRSELMAWQRMLTRIIIPQPSKPFESRCSSLGNLMIYLVTRPRNERGFRVVSLKSFRDYRINFSPQSAIERRAKWLRKCFDGWLLKTLVLAWGKVFHRFQKKTHFQIDFMTSGGRLSFLKRWGGGL